MTLTGKRHPFHALRGRLRRRGRLLGAARGADLRRRLGPRPPSDRSTARCSTSTTPTTCRPRGRGPRRRTNLVSHTAFRGFGGPQGMVVIEEIMDRVARHLRPTARAVRERNLYAGDGASNTTHYGQPLGDNRLRDDVGVADARRRSDSASAAPRWRASTPPTRHTKRGLGDHAGEVRHLVHRVVPQPGRRAGARLPRRHGAGEPRRHRDGPGPAHQDPRVAMRELGRVAERVRVMKTRTDKVPNTSATAASSGADLNGAAVKHACDQLRSAAGAGRGRPADGEHGLDRSIRRRWSSPTTVFAVPGEPSARGAVRGGGRARVPDPGLAVGERLLPHPGHRPTTRPGATASRSTTSRTAPR
jgi:hypothetical protein